MTLHVVRCDALEPQPWKNGGGLTREVPAWPAREQWALRLSVADIRVGWPFSAFPGVDRWFSVLEGAGLLLTIGSDSHVIRARADLLVLYRHEPGLRGIPASRRLAALVFSGTAAPFCDVLVASR